MYTTPPVTIGVAASEPKLGVVGTSAAGSLNVQACLRVDRLADEIVAPAASRVFARLPLAYGQDPAGVAALRSVVVVGVLALLLVHAVAATVTLRAMIRLVHAVFLASIAISSSAAFSASAATASKTDITMID